MEFITRTSLDNRIDSYQRIYTYKVKNSMAQGVKINQTQRRIEEP